MTEYAVRNPATGELVRSYDTATDAEVAGPGRLSEVMPGRLSDTVAGVTHVTVQPHQVLRGLSG
jgi:hypothetical protein